MKAAFVFAVLAAFVAGYMLAWEARGRAEQAYRSHLEDR